MVSIKALVAVIATVGLWGTGTEATTCRQGTRTRWFTNTSRSFCSAKPWSSQSLSTSLTGAPTSTSTSILTPQSPTLSSETSSSVIVSDTSTSEATTGSQTTTASQGQSSSSSSVLSPVDVSKTSTSSISTSSQTTGPGIDTTTSTLGASTTTTCLSSSISSTAQSTTATSVATVSDTTHDVSSSSGTTSSDSSTRTATTTLSTSSTSSSVQNTTPTGGAGTSQTTTHTDTTTSSSQTTNSDSSTTSSAAGSSSTTSTSPISSQFTTSATSSTIISSSHSSNSSFHYSNNTPFTPQRTTTSTTTSVLSPSNSTSSSSIPSSTASPTLSNSTTISSTFSSPGNSSLSTTQANSTTSAYSSDISSAPLNTTTSASLNVTSSVTLNTTSSAGTTTTSTTSDLTTSTTSSTPTCTIAEVDPAPAQKICGKTGSVTFDSLNYLLVAYGDLPSKESCAKRCLDIAGPSQTCLTFSYQDFQGGESICTLFTGGPGALGFVEGATGSPIVLTIYERECWECEPDSTTTTTTSTTTTSTTSTTSPAPECTPSRLDPLPAQKVCDQLGFVNLDAVNYLLGGLGDPTTLFTCAKSCLEAVGSQPCVAFTYLWNFVTGARFCDLYWAGPSTIGFTPNMNPFALTIYERDCWKCQYPSTGCEEPTVVSGINGGFEDPNSGQAPWIADSNNIDFLQTKSSDSEDVPRALTGDHFAFLNVLNNKGFSDPRFISKTLPNIQGQERYVLKYNVALVPSPNVPFICLLEAQINGVRLSDIPFAMASSFEPFAYREAAVVFTAPGASPSLKLQLRCISGGDSGTRTYQVAIDDVSVTTYISPCTLAAGAPAETCGRTGHIIGGHYGLGDALSVEACAQSCQQDQACLTFGYYQKQDTKATACRKYGIAIGDMIILPGQDDSQFEAQFYSPSCFQCNTCTN